VALHLHSAASLHDVHSGTVTFTEPFYDNIFRFKLDNFVLFRLKEHFTSYTFYLNCEVFNLLRN